MENRFDINYNLPKYTVLIKRLRSKFGDNLKILGEIADVICGPFGSAIKNTDYREEGIPLVRITNISKTGYMNYEDIVYISEELANSLSRTQVSHGDIVISQRGSLGQCAIVDNKFEKLNISANIIALKNIRNVSAEFIHDYFLSTIGQMLLERNVSGQVQQKLTTQDIANLLIPIGCDEDALISIVQESHKVYKSRIQQAEKLLNSIDKIVLNRLSIELPEYTDQLTYAVTLSDILFDKTMDVSYYHPERMAIIHMMKNAKIETKRLGSVVDFCRDTVLSKNSNLKYLGLAGVQSNTGELSGVSEDAEGQAFIYRKDDILYGRLRPYLNKVLLAESEGICSTEFYVMRVKNISLLPAYLAAIMRSSLILSQTKHMMTGNTHPRISNDDVRNLYIPVPNLETQRLIVRKITDYRLEARMLRQKANQDWENAKEQFDKKLMGE